MITSIFVRKFEKKLYKEVLEISLLELVEIVWNCFVQILRISLCSPLENFRERGKEKEERRKERKRKD